MGRHMLGMDLAKFLMLRIMILTIVGCYSIWELGSKHFTLLYTMLTSTLFSLLLLLNNIAMHAGA
jgi:hypothetical protein